MFQVGPLKTWIFYDFYGRAIENLDFSMIFKVGPFKMMGNHNFEMVLALKILFLVFFYSF